MIGISETIKEHPVEQLIMHEMSLQRQAEYYNVLSEKYYIMKRKGKIIEFQA